MARWPNPQYTKLVETDPQIVKVRMDQVEWGARPSIMPKGQDAKSNMPGQAPSAPEMGIRHTK